MSGYIPDHLRHLVAQRAGNCCEYCGLSQEGQEASFHIDHIIPVKEGGLTTADNLALACVSCSLRKAARLTAIDPQSQEEVPLYNPRQDPWSEHFKWEGVFLAAQTPVGGATLVALEMNRPTIVAIRREERLLGRHPPPGPAPRRIDSPRD